MNKKSFFKTLRTTLFSLLILLVVGSCSLGGLALDSFYLQHERAQARWSQREPFHYQYTVLITSSFWRNSFIIEMQNSQIVLATNSATGLPAEIWDMAPGSYLHQTNAIWDYMVVDRIFTLINQSRRTPKTFTAFLTRLNPGMYYSLAYKGLLPYERTTCDPAFPRVTYNQAYGYPERLLLGGNPCTTVIELAMPISIQIESFKVLR